MGEEIVTGSFTLDRDTMLAFSRMYDPQPLHVDEGYARAGPFGELIASGAQSISISLKLFVQMGYLDGVCLAGPGMDEVRFLRPVRAGDTLQCHIRVAEARISRSNPTRGVLRLNYALRNQQGEDVLTHTSTTMVQARPRHKTGT
ncbi:MAG: MaoC/PaaZ C-terminal domain-containing protein [Roseovarius sp.]